MNKKGILYSLLVLGILVIGGGAWMLATAPPDIDIPEEPPVVYEQLDYVMRGEFCYLYIYRDGSIIYIEEKGLRPSGAHPTRTWRTGQFTPQQLDSLLSYLESSGIEEMEEYYQFSGKPNESGGFSMGDMSFTVSVYSGILSKTVTAFGYISPDNGETYPDMPPPLDEIYGRLRLVAIPTGQVYQEDIKD